MLLKNGMFGVPEEEPKNADAAENVEDALPAVPLPVVRAGFSWFWVLKMKKTRNWWPRKNTKKSTGCRLTWILSVPLSAQFCLGWWVCSRRGWAPGQDSGTPKSKSTQPRSTNRWDTLYSLASFPRKVPPWRRVRQRCRTWSRRSWSWSFCCAPTAESTWTGWPSRPGRSPLRPDLSEIQGDSGGRAPGLGWLWFWSFLCLPGSAWANGNLAELAGQQGKMVKH